jgi:hypothetical protein
MGASPQIHTVAGPVQCQRVSDVAVYRVGYPPEPWNWTAWEYASDGRFDGRWDDPHGVWRTVYVGSSALACYLEVLARFRADPAVADELASIVDDEEYPTAAAGTLSPSWCKERVVAAAEMSGVFALPSHHETLPTLRQRFVNVAKGFGLDDVDAAAVRDSRPRALTQAIAAWIYTLSTADGIPLTGIQFQSRHGDALRLWAIYERAGSGQSPPEIRHRSLPSTVQRDDPALVEAMRIHRLTWTAT